MCADNPNCGRFTRKDLANRVVFTKPSVVRKLKSAEQANKVPSPVRLETKAGFELRYCSVHLKYLGDLQANL